MDNCILKSNKSLIRDTHFQDAKVVVKNIQLIPDAQIDKWMDDYVRNHLSESFTNIFIPLSFGQTLTDFLGLRLSLHIRTTHSSPNRRANIYIYSALTIEEIPKDTALLQILLTQGTMLIDYSLEEILRCSKKENRVLSDDLLTKTLNRLQLELPESYNDNHSIANIWGIFRLLRTAGIDPNTIESIRNQQDKLTGLHFKWLLAKQQHTWQALSHEEVLISTHSPALIKNILLIDDESNKGWTDALTRVLKIPTGKLTVASTIEEATTMLSDNVYQLIFLDLRLGEKDHNISELQNMGGYLLLKRDIRNSFDSKNFATPVILLTASSKAWNIKTLLNEGADDYFIKEAPEQANSSSFSDENFKRLQGSFSTLIKVEKKRREIWEFSVNIENRVKKIIEEENIKTRISEKLKIGYGLLFRHSTQLEKNILISNNETLAFLVYWSILEEISHDFYDRSQPYTWVLKKTGKIFLKVDPDNPDMALTLFKTIRKSKETEKSINKQDSGLVYLSDQISGILRHQLLWNHHKINDNFMKPLNNYRNEIDFIHSSPTAILHGRLADYQNNEDVYKKCKTMIKLLINILS
ncbi:hypothetical protein MRBLMN1_005878 [Chitinophaga ginsengisegetis]|uniref:response regulator n=1 Tax=Chitinophaga ginsengisegetis TaxID=393003 RepID=UPI0034441E63